MLLAAIDAGGLPRFRTKARNDFASWLEQQGFVDRRERLTDAEVEFRVMAAALDPVEDGVILPAEIRSTIAALRAGVEVSPDTAPDRHRG